MINGHKVFDCFPIGFASELDILDLRLHEMAPIVDTFVILESKETYGGEEKPLCLKENWQRFKKFHDRILYVGVDKLFPPLTHTLKENIPGISADDIRIIGRQREANQRDQILLHLQSLKPAPMDIISFGDADEIPRESAIRENAAAILEKGIHRLKQTSYYYGVTRITDYGHDWASRARVGRYQDLLALGSMYAFRMAKDVPVIENGGWHFGYFGGVDAIERKVAAMAPFLSEYKLFGRDELVKDMKEGRDLHHRRCEELPDSVFAGARQMIRPCRRTISRIWISLRISFRSNMQLWNGYRAALSITMDDCLKSQLDNAVPAMDARKIVGTFFGITG